MQDLSTNTSDIKLEPSVLAADVIGIAESWLCELDNEEDFTLEGFTMFRNDANSSHVRSHHGIVVYLRTVCVLQLFYFQICRVFYNFIYVIEFSNTMCSFIQTTLLYSSALYRYLEEQFASIS